MRASACRPTIQICSRASPGRPSPSAILATPEQKELRAWYTRLLRLTDVPAFRRGEFIPLNRANLANPRYGRLPGETASGHWLYAFVRWDSASGQRFLIVANLHGTHTLREIRVTFSPDAISALGAATGDARFAFLDRLEAKSPVRLTTAAAALRAAGLDLPPLPPLTAMYFEVASE